MIVAVSSAQDEVLRALSFRPSADAPRAKDNIDRLFLYEYEQQEIPLMDDFSVDRTRKRNAQVGDPGVTYDQTLYHLAVGGASTADMRFNSDTTFTYTIDGSDPPVRTREPLESIMVTLFDLSVYPPTSEEVEVWPAYNVYDTLTSPPRDTVFLTSVAYIQDSLLLYSVAPEAGTYLMNNVATPLVLWQDDDVYVNGSYPIDPPTIGVATFDGLARTGYPYDFPNYSAYGQADHLTSVPIDLEYPASDSIYLSFFYQTQGLSGDAEVQPIDSLILEFYAPLEQSWYKVWGIGYVDPADFQQVLIPITQGRFLKEGFQFRFTNYATLSGSFDHWHLDYVRLAAQRTFDDTRLVDVAYLYPETSILQTYTSVPFNQFEVASSASMALSVDERIRNLDINDRFITYGMTARSEDGGPTVNFSNGLNSSGNASQIFTSTHAINSAPNDFVYNNDLSTDAAFWDVKFWANTTPDINPYNDTIRLVQELSNYYAYDDGSAEAGYGLTAAGARLAYRYDLIGPDSLRAVRMYFNPLANTPPALPPTQGVFLLTVWSSLDPEVVQHQNVTFSTPEYRMDGIDKFVEYELDSVIYVQGTIYIGWIQTNTAAMNLGFDKNRNNRTKIFYRTGGSWTNTSFEGSLMMRPVFIAALDPWAGVEEEGTVGHGLIVYPNPASELFRVKVEGEVARRSTVVCQDATGRLVLQEPYVEGGAIPTSGLSPGVYVVRVNEPSGTSVAQGRLVVQR
ncbi:MAG: T9SS type A sorting domain-containing protein [Flavobacteriales bacterium]|nr:T9SS type A sorting domain-containing protein [Flavobacteriales bacterium]